MDSDANVNASSYVQKASNITTAEDRNAFDNAGPSGVRHEGYEPVQEQLEFQIDPFLLSLSAEALAEGSALQMHSNSQAGPSSNGLFADMMAANGPVEGHDSRLDGMVGFQMPAGESWEAGSSVSGRGRGRGRGRGKREGGEVEVEVEAGLRFPSSQSLRTQSCSKWMSMSDCMDSESGD